MPSTDITMLLREVRSGNAEAQSRLAELVYGELHRIAEYYMSRERSDHSLQATVLVNEAFIRLMGKGNSDWQNRTYFFAAAAQVMRRVLIDYSRTHRAEKRGGGSRKIELNDAIAFSAFDCENWIAVDEALDRLEKRDARLARIVELRFFAGLTEEEIAEHLGISARTVKREWRVAKAWLYAELSGADGNDARPMGAR